MDYQDAVNNQIRPRSLAFLNSVGDTLRPLGITDITIGEVDATDLRFQLTANGTLGRSFTCAVELTDTLRYGGVANGKGVLTLTASDAGGPITLTSYSDDVARSYSEPSGADQIVAKLDDVEASLTEVIAKARVALGV